MSRFRCTCCAQTFAVSAQLWQCDCGGPLDLECAAMFDPGRVAGRPPTLWRYREALPVAADAATVTLGEGLTPLLSLDLDGRTVLVKQEHLAPTGSYKDRGAAVLISHARELGVRRVVEDSSGNAGAAIAAYCARAGLACDIYVPASTSAAKVAQIERVGARVVQVPGSREDTARACRSAAATTFYASHCWNPFFLLGTKTFAYEVCEQLGWRAPDAVIVPVGHGTLLLGAALGFEELRQAGIIAHVPRLIGVQAAACAPLAQAFMEQRATPAACVPQATAAEGIAIAAPVRGAQILAAVRDTGGWFVAVSEQEIADALRLMHRAGFFIEPTAAATIAGVRQYLASAEPGEEIVTAFTGHGLKALSHKP